MPLSAGLIDEQEAAPTPWEITAEADFYGAMDGASKFVRETPLQDQSSLDQAWWVVFWWAFG